MRLKSMLFLAFAVAGLAACSGSQPDDGGADGNDAVPTSQATAKGEPGQVEGRTPSPASDPASSPSPRYHGRWATSEAQCSDKPWTFAERGLSTAGGKSCRLEEVREVPGGYDVAAICAGKKDDFTIRFAESARAMLVEGSSVLPESGLIRCGPA